MNSNPTLSRGNLGDATDEFTLRDEDIEVVCDDVTLSDTQAKNSQNQQNYQNN